MKLFFQEHFLLIAIQCLQFSVILTIYWLDGYHNLKPALYASFLGFFILGCYLFYHYYSRREFYKRLSKPLLSPDDAFQRMEQAPISEALNKLMKMQYKHYHQQLSTVDHQQKEHLTFMDQWVHQMKTPLSVIELTAQNLDEPESSDIREETERMQIGLNTILYMARLRTIEQDFHVKQVLVKKVVDEVNRDNRRLYIRNQVYPKLEERTQSILVETDEKWLFFILSQLVQNAVKYSTGKSNKLILSLYEKENEAVLEVTDFGVGIPEFDIKRVFDPFYTGDNGRKFRESTGMGLYLTKEVVNHLGHRIEIESIVGEGTSVRIIFTQTQNLTTL